MGIHAEITEGIYLSEPGLTRVRDIFSAFARDDIPYLKKLFDEVHHSTFGSEWSSFDDAYRDIYYLNVTSEKHLVNFKQRLSKASEKQKRCELTVIFDFKFPNVNRNSSFESSLIDETQVADLIRLRRSVENLIPYESSLSTFAVGCLWLEFSIFANRSSADQQEGLIGLKQDTLAMSPGWQRLKRRFDIADDSISLRYV